MVCKGLIWARLHFNFCNFNFFRILIKIKKIPLSDCMKKVIHDYTNKIEFFYSINCLRLSWAKSSFHSDCAINQALGFCTFPFQLQSSSSFKPARLSATAAASFPLSLAETGPLRFFFTLGIVFQASGWLVDFINNVLWRLFGAMLWFLGILFDFTRITGYLISS